MQGIHFISKFYKILILCIPFLFSTSRYTKIHSSELQLSIELIKSSPSITTQLVNINTAPNACNASLVPIGSQYLLAFRQDLRQIGYKRSCKIGYAMLDENFNQFSQAVFLPSKWQLAEDPRLFFAGNKLNILHSYYISDKINECRMALSEFDPNNKTLYSPKTLLYGTPVEKNWTPFVYSYNNKQNIYFIYKFNPFEIIKLCKDNTLKQLYFHGTQEKLDFWEKNWGKISGGTPALLVDGEYLTFFHSSFYESGNRIYVLGALTFAAQPPFELKKISRTPITSQDFYTASYSTHTHFYPKNNFKVIFPCGFFIEKDTTYIACGENDSAIRLCILNKDELYQKMISLDDDTLHTINKKIHTLCML